MKRITKSPRWVILLATGSILVILFKMTLSHPFFWLCVDTETTVWECERDKNAEILLRAMRSPILPHSVRVQSLRGILNIKDRHGERIFLTNEEIDKLKEIFIHDFDAEVLTLFLNPYIDEKINPRVVNLIMDPQQKRGVRLIAFMNLAQTPELTNAQALQIKNIWDEIEPEELQNLIHKFIDSLSENDHIDTELTNLFIKDGAMDKSLHTNPNDK